MKKGEAGAHKLQRRAKMTPTAPNFLAERYYEQASKLLYASDDRPTKGARLGYELLEKAAELGHPCKFPYMCCTVRMQKQNTNDIFYYAVAMIDLTCCEKMPDGKGLSIV